MRRLCFRLAALLLTIFAAVFPSGAQPRYIPAVEPGDSLLAAELLTCAPGRDVYELEGHSGLRIVSSQFDVVVHWGLFDFNAPNFIYRFCKGETDYSIGMSPTSAFLAEYASQHRRVTAQRLNLTPAQIVRAVDLINDNLQPANRVYRYNYVLDNCATRPLGIIEQALGEPVVIDSASAMFDADVTFRKEMRYFHANYPWYQFGIDLALGSGIDYRIDIRRTAFAPVVLQALAASAEIYSGPEAKLVPLVSSTTVLVDGPEEGPVKGPTPWILSPMAVALLILLVALGLCLMDLRRRKVSRWFDALLFGLYGLAGCVITFLIVISVHEATSPNILIFWLNPLLLLVPALIWFRRMRVVVFAVMGLSLAATLTCALCLLCGVQDYNSSFMPLMAASAIRALNYLIINRDVVRKTVSKV